MTTKVFWPPSRMQGCSANASYRLWAWQKLCSNGPPGDGIPWKHMKSLRGIGEWRRKYLPLRVMNLAMNFFWYYFHFEVLYKTRFYASVSEPWEHCPLSFKLKVGVCRKLQLAISDNGKYHFCRKICMRTRCCDKQLSWARGSKSDDNFFHQKITKNAILHQDNLAPTPYASSVQAKIYCFHGEMKYHFTGSCHWSFAC